MKRIEKVFLICVFGFAGFFSWKSLCQSVAVYERRSSANTVAVGSAGKSRNVDLPKLERLIEQQSLSDHEADFYKRLDRSTE